MPVDSPLIPALSPQGLSGEPSGWRFATSIGPWGPLLAGYYETSREALPFEREFWASLVKPTSTIIEIGAGSGFISKSLAEASPQLLTLVEPEPEHLKLLRQALPSWKTHSQVDIVQAFFENAQ
ncbi:MAG: rRNA adenine N-6-methyltransferase family protein, partial [Bdellovibrionales bacterium]